MNHYVNAFLRSCAIVLALGMALLPRAAVAQEPSPLGTATGLWVQPDGQGSDVVLALIDQRLWRLAADGRTSTNIGPQQGGVWVVSFGVRPTTTQPTFDGTLWAATVEGIYKTSDAGRSWVALDHGDPCRVITRYTVVSDAFHLITTRCNGVDAIHVSLDGGQTWAKRHSFAPGVRVARLSLSLSNATRSWARTSQGLFVSEDSGFTWKQVQDADNAALRDLFAALPRDGDVRDYISAHNRNVPPRAELVALQGVGAFVSRNVLGGGWMPFALMNAGLPVFDFGYSVSAIDEQFYLPVVGHGLYRLDPDDTWRLAISEQALPGINRIFRFHSDSQLWFAQSRTSGIWRSTDGGRNWKRWGVNDVTVVPSDDEFTAPQGTIGAENVSVSTVGSVEKLTLTVELRIPELEQMPRTVKAATRSSAPAGEAVYQVFVVALAPGQLLGVPEPVILQKPESGAWELITSPLASFIRNVTLGSQDNRVLIEIVKDSDLSGIVGTEFYIGYGISDEEMLLAQRYRGVYKIR